VAGLISLPLGAYVYLAETSTVAMLCAIIPGVLSGVYLGPSIAAAHGLVGARMRALTSAIVSLISNLIGLGLGPFVIGLLSDLMAPSKGVESLRYAMLYVIPFATFIWRPSRLEAIPTLLRLRFFIPTLDLEVMLSMALT